MIYLICGMTCSGKTTLLGKLASLDKAESVEFIDLDGYVLAKEGHDDLSSFLKHNDMDKWYQISERYLFTLINQSRVDTIVALGGGSFTQEVVNGIQENPGVVSIWLETPIELCFERLLEDGNTDRPSFDLIEKTKFDNLFHERSKLFAEADIKLSTEEVNELSNIEEFLSFRPKIP